MTVNLELLKENIEACKKYMEQSYHYIAIVERRYFKFKILNCGLVTFIRVWLYIMEKMRNTRRKLS